AAPREAPDKDFKCGASVKAVLDIARRHGELIEVREQPRVRLIEKHVLPQSMTVGPKGQRETGAEERTVQRCQVGRFASSERCNLFPINVDGTVQVFL